MTNPDFKTLLTPLQLEILELVAGGLSIQKAASKLGMRYGQLRSRLSVIYLRIRAHSVESAVAIYLGEELPPDEPEYSAPKQWTDTGLECVRLGQDCGACSIFKAYGRHKNGGWASKCHQPESNHELMRKGILPPKSNGISTGMTVPGRLRKKG